MAYAEESRGLRGPKNDQSTALAQEWRKLTRAATIVAILTSPTCYFALHDAFHWSVIASVLVTVLVVVGFRGIVEVVVRKLLPWPSLLNAGEELKQEDLIARRRYWYWRTKVRRFPVYVAIVFGLLGLCQALFAFSGVSAPFFDPFTGLRTLFPPDELPSLLLQLIFIPVLLFANIVLFLGPIAFMAARSIKSFEPGDARLGVKIDDVRGQAESKEEITRVITLWQSGEEFEKAGGKRERGLLFLGAPGTGKTMISKAIATEFNCPFVTIPGSGFAQMFVGMDAFTVQLLARRARKLARKWGGQCIVFIDEIDAVGMRRAALGSMTESSPVEPRTVHDLGFYGPMGAINPSGDLIIESAAWRERQFAMRAEHTPASSNVVLQRVGSFIDRYIGGMGGFGGGGQALNQLLVVMDGMGEPPVMKKAVVNRINTFLDAMFVIPQRIGRLRLRVPTPAPRKEEIYFIGACNVPLEVLDPALTRPGRMGRHIWFRTPTKDDRKDIFDLYMAKVNHDPELDTERRRDELARITNGYSPSMIEQSCSMALTIAHSEGRPIFGWNDIVEAMTTVESGTAQNIEYHQAETRSTAIHEAGHAVAGHMCMGDELISTRLSIRKRGSSLGHYQSMEKDERFIQFRSFLMGRLVMILGAMAAEHVFYGENSQGVGGDVYMATSTAAAMVGTWAMGPEPLPMSLPPVGDMRPGAEVPPETSSEKVAKRLAQIGETIMRRGGENDYNSGILSSPAKRRAAAELIGQAYVTAYALMSANQAQIEEIAAVLMEQKEIYGDAVGELLNSVGLVLPEIDLHDDSTWPTV